MDGRGRSRSIPVRRHPFCVNWNPMLSVYEAWQRIVDSVSVAEPHAVRLNDARGLVLWETIRADADSPPFDKALMDGYALKSSDVLSGTREYRVLAEITAGRVFIGDVQRDEAVQIMTGAPIPGGVDCVIPVERTTRNADRVTIELESPRAGMNIARRGESLRCGDEVLPAGVELGPAQLGALAEMGRAVVQAVPAPSVAILATGDELVPFDELPGTGQVRNSNELMLTAQAEAAGATARPLGVAMDERGRLEDAVRRGFESDFLCLSGGVSAGTRDLVPAVLRELGVEEEFHGCNVKPGRPIYFGKLTAGVAPDGRPHWIFGLPGNPVSSMVCFELFVRTAIRRRRGVEPAVQAMTAATLASRHESKDARPTFFPAIATDSADGLLVETIDWKGSFDLQSVARANSLVLFEERREYPAGERVRIVPLSTAR
jgi:molybdopterin molybdotransferase